MGLIQRDRTNFIVVRMWRERTNLLLLAMIGSSLLEGDNNNNNI
jgi:hypothetical protein